MKGALSFVFAEVSEIVTFPQIWPSCNRVIFTLAANTKELGIPMSLERDYKAVGSRRIKNRIGDGEGNPYGKGPIQLSFLNDGRLAVCAVRDGVLNIQNFSTGQIQHTFFSEEKRKAAGRILEERREALEFLRMTKEAEEEDEKGDRDEVELDIDTSSPHDRDEGLPPYSFLPFLPTGICAIPNLAGETENLNCILACDENDCCLNVIDMDKLEITKKFGKPGTITHYNTL
jgi:hypothetical protein